MKTILNTLVPVSLYPYLTEPNPSPIKPLHERVDFEHDSSSGEGIYRLNR